MTEEQIRAFIKKIEDKVKLMDGVMREGHAPAVAAYNMGVFLSTLRNECALAKAEIAA